MSNLRIGLLRLTTCVAAMLGAGCGDDELSGIRDTVHSRHDGGTAGGAATGGKADAGTAQDDAAAHGGEEPPPRPRRDGGPSACPLNDNVEELENACVVRGTLLQDLTLPSDTKTWRLVGPVFVGTDVDEGGTAATLTIEAGTTVYGDIHSRALLAVARGSKLIAEGTASEPIVFTSGAATDRAAGDWGGVVINGRAPISCAAAPCEGQGEGGTGAYGGDDPADDSGVLRFVRVEFAGDLISPGNALPGIGLRGVGSATVIDHVQVHRCAGDGVAFFGGSAGAKHVVLSGVGDDGLAWTQGWAGKLQFLIAQQWPGEGDQGLEGSGNVEGHAYEPFSNPVISHVTLVGVPEDSRSDIGLLLRGGTRGALSNMIVIGFNEACFAVDHEPTATNLAAGLLSLERSILSCALDFAEGDGVTSAQAASLFAAGSGNREIDDRNALLRDAFTVGTPDFRLAPSSEAEDRGAPPDDPFFEESDVIGAMGDDDWTAPWVQYPGK